MPTKSSRANRAASRPQSRVFLSDSIHLWLPNGDHVSVTPTIVHTLRAESYGFADDKVLDSSPPLHRFDVIIEREFIRGTALTDEPPTDEVWEQLAAAFAPPRKPRRERIEPSELGPRRKPGELWLAYLEIAELATHLVEAAGGWYHVCDAEGGALRAALPIILQAEKDWEHDLLPGGLIDGALLYPQMLGVHPLVRGQEIGLQLLAHGLSALQRSTSDVVVMEAAAIRSHFDAVEPEQTPESFRALCAYYARLGFRRCYPRTRYTNRDCNVMALAIGHQGMRVR